MYVPIGKARWFPSAVNSEVEEALRNTDFQQIYLKLKERQVVSEGDLVRTVFGMPDDEDLISFVGSIFNRIYYRRFIDIMVELGLFEITTDGTGAIRITELNRNDEFTWSGYYVVIK